MRLSELLNPKAVTLNLQARTKADVLVELAGVLEEAHGLQSGGRILAKVEHRERMMSTGIGNGVAIPHGKDQTVTRMAAACGVSPEGVDFDAEDGQPARLFVLFVSPESAATDHVRVLGNISRLLKEESVRKDLVAAESPEAFLAIIQGAEAAYIP